MHALRGFQYRGHEKNEAGREGSIWKEARIYTGGEYYNGGKKSARGPPIFVRRCFKSRQMGDANNPSWHFSSFPADVNEPF